MTEVNPPKRRRAAKACIGCRERKVRCDVVYRGQRCTNCALDGRNCIVKNRKMRQIKIPSVHDFVIPQMNPPAPSELSSSSTGSLTARLSDSSTDSSRNTPAGSSLASNEPLYEPNTTNGLLGHVTSECSIALDLGSLDNSVLYSTLPFLELDNLGNVRSAGVDFLMVQGCFYVPIRAYLTEFLREYFLHVHPLLPILDEDTFWETYRTGSLLNYFPDREKISLFVIQSILFVSCGFVSSRTIRAIGFTSVREAKFAFYNRAKGLFDHDSVRDPISLAQGSLLLTYWGNIDDGRCRNTFWLSTAIQNARNAGAHSYQSTACPEMPVSKRKNLKRLWWCCFIRDRLMSLGLRRPIQITREHFNFDHDDDSIRMCILDYAPEVMHFSIYTKKETGSLCQIFVALYDLCCILTDVLMLVYPLSESIQILNQASCKKNLADCRRRLVDWYNESYQSIALTIRSSGMDHESIRSFVRLILIYYYSAQISLCNFELLQLTLSHQGVAQPAGSLSIASELEKAFQGTIDCTRDILHRQQAKYMPSTAAACTALPLLLSVLDVRLANQGQTVPVGRDKRGHLTVLLDVMDVYRCQYEGVDTISETIQQTIESGPPLPHAVSWADVIIQNPLSYLKLAMGLDLTLTKGRLFRICDFPHQVLGPIYQASPVLDPASEIINQTVTQMTMVDNEEGPTGGKEAGPEVQDFVNDRTHFFEELIDMLDSQVETDESLEISDIF